MNESTGKARWVDKGWRRYLTKVDYGRYERTNGEDNHLIKNHAIPCSQVGIIGQ